MLQEMYRVVKSDETILDIVYSVYGSCDNVYNLMSDNNLSYINQELTATTSLYYNPELIDFKPNNLYLYKKEITPTITVQTFDNQSIYDVCLQNYGNLDNLFKFLTDNSISSVDNADLELNDVILTKNKISSKYNDLSYFSTLDKSIQPIILSDYLLLEDSYYILLESGYKIILD